MIPQNPHQPKNGWFTNDPRQTGMMGGTVSNRPGMPSQNQQDKPQIPQSNPFAPETNPPAIPKPTAQPQASTKNPFLDESMSQPPPDLSRIARAPPTEEFQKNTRSEGPPDLRQPNNTFVSPGSVNNSPNTSTGAANRLNRSEEEKLHTVIQGFKQKLEQTEDKWNHLKEKYRLVKKDKENLQTEVAILTKKCQELEISTKQNGRSDSHSASKAELEKTNSEYYARIRELEDIHMRTTNELEECKQKLNEERRKYDKLKKETDIINKSDSDGSRTNIMQIMLPLNMDNESRDISPNQEKLIRELGKQLKEKDARIQELQRKWEESQEMSNQLTKKLLLSSGPSEPAKVAALPQPEQRRPTTRSIGLSPDPTINPATAPAKQTPAVRPVMRSVATETPPLTSPLKDGNASVVVQNAITAGIVSAQQQTQQQPQQSVNSPVPSLSPTNSATSLSAAPAASVAHIVEPLKLKLDEANNSLRVVTAENKLLRERLEELILENDRLNKEGAKGTSIRLAVEPGSILADVSFSDAGGPGLNPFFPDGETQNNPNEKGLSRESRSTGGFHHQSGTQDKDQQKFSDGGEKNNDRGEGNWKKSKSGDNRHPNSNTKDLDKPDLRYPAGYAREDQNNDKDRNDYKDKPWNNQRNDRDDWRDDDRDRRMGGYRTHNSERNVPHVSGRGQGSRGYGGEFRGGKAGSNRGKGRFQYESSDQDYYMSDEDDGYQKNHRGGRGKDKR